MITRILLVAVLASSFTAYAEETIEKPLEDMSAILGASPAAGNKSLKNAGAKSEAPTKRKKIIDIESLLKDDVANVAPQSTNTDMLGLGAKADRIIEITYQVASKRMMAEGGFKPFAYLMKDEKLFLVTIKQEFAKDFTQAQIVPVIKKLLKQYIAEGEWEALVMYSYATVGMSNGKKQSGFMIELEFSSGASLDRFWQVTRNGKEINYGNFVDIAKKTRYFIKSQETEASSEKTAEK